MRQAIADTGALVALLDRSDQYHEWAVECFKIIEAPVLSCESVLAETWHLLGAVPHSRSKLSCLHSDGIIQVPLEFQAQSGSIWRLLEKYDDIPMHLAHACVVRLSEIYPKHQVWTVDSDFKFYRRNQRAVIPLLAPWVR